MPSPTCHPLTPSLHPLHSHNQNWARVAAAVVGVLGGSAAQRRGHVEHTRPAVPSVVPAHGPGSQGWRSPINPGKSGKFLQVSL